MTAKIALYKGPPSNDWRHTISHYAIRMWTWSRWSHAELVIDGVCYSSSRRDGGVRSKVIDLASGRWDIEVLPLTPEEIARALGWFDDHEDDKYDDRNILRFLLPPMGHSQNRWVCFESIAAALGLAGAHKLTANDLYLWAKSRQAAIIDGNRAA